MQSLRVLTDGDQELTSFLLEVRATLVAPPTGSVATALPARLAAEARGVAPVPIAMNGDASRRRRRSPLARPLLRVALAVAAIPLLFTGLAFAGVRLPDPANSAFESIGIDLPNQAEDGRDGGVSGVDDDGAGTAHDGGDGAGSATGQSNSNGKLGNGRAKQGPANAEGVPGKGRQVTGKGIAPAGIGPSGEEGKSTGKPDAPPGGGQSNGAPPDPPAPPEPPSSPVKPEGGVPMNGLSASRGGGDADPGDADGAPQ